MQITHTVEECQEIFVDVGSLLSTVKKLAILVCLCIGIKIYH